MKCKVFKRNANTYLKKQSLGDAIVPSYAKLNKKSIVSKHIQQKYHKLRIKEEIKCIHMKKDRGCVGRNTWC
jgi:hypothetical protein